MTFLVESINRDTRTDLYLFSRDKNGKKSMEIVKDFKPRFFVPEDDEIPDDKRITGVKSGYTSINGEKVKKIYTQTAYDIKDIKDKFSKHFEADVNFAQRYIINKIGPIDTYPLVKFYFDIEVASQEGFPEPSEAKFPIVSIALEDDSSKDNKLMLFLEKEDATVPCPDADNIIKFTDEVSLLQYFIAEIIKRDPDIITGWNVEEFDLYYIIHRMEKLGVDFRKLSPLYSVKISEFNKKLRVKIKGRIIIDMMRGYKYFRKISNQGRAERYTLEFTAQDVLKTGKLPHEESFYELWRDNPQKLIDYNFRDNELVRRIQEKLDIVEFFNSIRVQACSQLSDIFSTSKLTDGFLLRKCRLKYVLPSSNPNADTSKITYSGATVIKPIPGVFDNVLGLDIKGMYPNIIKTFNIGYETFNPNGPIQLAEGIGFNHGIGLISETVRELEIERNEWKAKRKIAYKNDNKQDYKVANFKQYAVKVITNAIYGYLGYTRSRLYKREVAEAITTAGREIILYSKAKVEDLGYRVLYGDTDSIYVEAKTTSLSTVKIEGFHLTDMLNKTYDDFAKKRGSNDPTLEMQFEKALKKVIFVSKRGEEGGAKKKYAYLYLWEDGKDVEGKIGFTGFETKRSDSPRVGREIQKTVLEMILKDKKREDVLAYLENIDKQIRNREIPDEEVGFPKGISNELYKYGKEKKVGNTKIKVGVPPIIKGAIYANKYLGQRFEKGSKPKWIYIKKVPHGFPETEILSYEEFIPDGFIPDYDEINKRIFQYKLAEIWKAAGWGEFPILNNNIKTLDKWGF